MSDVPAVKDSLAGMREKLDELVSQIETAKRDFETILQALNSLLPSVESIEVAASESLASVLDLERIKLTLRNLAAGNNQEEILEAYLQETQPLLKKAILFLQKDDSYVPWKARGFKVEQIEAISRHDLYNPIMQAVERTKIIILRRQLKGVFPWLQEEAEPVSTALCVPLVFQERVPVVLYGDSSDIVSIDSVELISHLAMLVLKNQSLQEMVAGAAEVVDEDTVERSVSEEAETTEDEALEQTPAEVPTEDVSAADPKIEPPPPAPDFETSEKDVQPQELNTTLILEPDVTSTTPKQEPLTTAISQVNSMQQEDPEEKYHTEARRLSRTLVSEIKLNKTEKINQGLESKNIYSHLKDEIDERREAYQSKVHPAVASKKDYYHEEIVSILAAGDESLIGDDYPGRMLIPKP